MNSVFEQCYYSGTAKSNIKIGNNSIRLMKWLHNLIDIIKKNKFDWLVSVLSALNEYLNIKCYVGKKGKRYGNHPLQNFILEERKEPKSLRTQNQVMNDTKKGTNQKLINNGSNELEIRQYPKNKIKQKIGKPNLDVEYHI